MDVRIRIIKSFAVAACVAVSAGLATAEKTSADAGVFVVKGPWEMAQATAPGKWMPAVVPGTVLNTLVKNGIVPDPYYGLNNKRELGLIPDVADAGRDFYTATFRCDVDLPADYAGKTVWMRPEGINYRSEIWLNGRLAAVTAGMFARNPVNVTKFVKPGARNHVEVKVFPVDHPGRPEQKKWGAKGEWHNGGDGEIGRNVTMLMSAGWDFTFSDGIRDRNTGIWRDLTFFPTGTIRLDAPFVKTKLNKDMSEATLEIEVEVSNATGAGDYASGRLEVAIAGDGPGIVLSREITLFRGERRVETFETKLKRPELWWPRNKGAQFLFVAKFRVDGESFDAWDWDMEGHKKTIKVPRAHSHEVSCKFGVREVYSDQSGPDGARQFYVNGRKVFIRGTNWIPEAMLKADDARMEKEIRLTAESGVNLVRLWGGGIVESDRFYDLCDKYGLLVWQEFWMTGDTRHPDDQHLYLANLSDQVKRIRMHPSLCHYVASNESSETAGTRELIERLDGTRSYMMQSECDGVHDGSPYYPVNPMGYYMDKATPRGSRIYGFSPEYGTCALPAADQCRKFMPESMLWPMDVDAWKYREGGGFDKMTEFHHRAVNAYGESTTFDEYCRKSQAADALAHRALWEAWNLAMNRATGVLFWYNNTPIPQLGSHAWDYDLDQTASFFAQRSALAPLHVQYEYLSNRVSVVNDTYSDRRFSVKAAVYGFDSRKLWERKADIVARGTSCADAFTIPFGELSAANPILEKPHFVKVWLMDGAREVDSTFYWRSKSVYEGQDSATGPCSGGFAALSELPRTSLSVCRADHGVTVRNVGDRIAFRGEVRALDETGRRIVPTHYSDNFFSLLPGESRDVLIECDTEVRSLGVSAWNCPSESPRDVVVNPCAD